MIIFPLKANTVTRNLTAIYILILLVASRQFEFKQDLLSYYKWATWGFYTYREPVFPYLNALTYDIFNGTNIFFLSDFISVIIIRNIFQKNKLHHTYMLIFFCFFPVIMGFQSIYRQFFGTLICLYIISFYYTRSEPKNIPTRPVTSLLRNLVAIATHNVHGVSIFAIKISNLRLSYNFLLSATLGAMVVLFFDSLGKSSQNTGSATVIFYLIVLLTLAMCFLLNKDKVGFHLSISGSTIISIMWLGGLETPSERVGLTFLVLLFISLVFFVDRFKPKFLVRFTLLVFGFFPLYVSPAITLLSESFLYV